MKKAKTAETAAYRLQPDYRCPRCGGKVKMVTEFRNGMRHFARCNGCGAQWRKLSDIG